MKLLRFTFRMIKSELPIFQGFLPLKGPLVATFSETRALTSRKYVAEQGMNVNRKHELTCSNSPVFTLD